MPEVTLVGGLLTPTLRVSLLLSLMIAGLLVARFAARLGLDGAWSRKVAEYSVWVGILGARLGFVAANWSAYSSAPWTIPYIWQGDFLTGLEGNPVSFVVSMGGLPRSTSGRHGAHPDSARCYCEVQKEDGPLGATVVGIDRDEPPETVQRNVEGVGVPYLTWLNDRLRNAPDRTRDLYTRIGAVLLAAMLTGRHGMI